MIDIHLRQSDDILKAANVLSEVHAVNGYPVEGIADPVGWLQPPGFITAWVAAADESVVGHVSLSDPGLNDGAYVFWRQRNPEDHPAVLGRLFVSPTTRGQGVGQQLVETAMRYADQRQRTLILDVLAKDRAAQRLYERLGWIEIGRTTHPFGDNQSARATCYARPANTW